MVHNCVDWSSAHPIRKVPFLILSYGDHHLYVRLPGSFSALEETTRKKFNLAADAIKFYSSCVNFCSDDLVEIDEDIWEDIVPYIGCIMVTQKKPSEAQSHIGETVLDESLVIVDDQASLLSGESITKGSDIDELCTRTCDSYEVHVATAASNALCPPSLQKTVRDYQEDGSTPRECATPLQGGIEQDWPQLRRSANCWVAQSIGGHAFGDVTLYSPARAKCRFTGLLNKITRKNVNFICAQLITWINGCDPTVQGQVLKLALGLIFERAVDEPERVGIYVNLLEFLDSGVTSRHFMEGASGTVTNGHSLIFSCLETCWKEAFKKKYLSWGEAIHDSVVTLPVAGSVEEYYAAEKAKRLGIGLAGLIVELRRLDMLQLQENVSGEAFLTDLLRNLEDNPREGDVVSLCILIQNIEACDTYWSGERRVRSEIFSWFECFDYRTDCMSACTKLTEKIRNNISPRIRCRLLDLWDLCMGSQQLGRRLITYHILHDGLRYSTPDVSRWCAASFNSQAVSEHFALVDEECHWWYILYLVSRPSQHNARTIGEFLAEALLRGLCSLEALEEGFTAAVKVLDVIGINDAQAYHRMATIWKGAGLDKMEEVVGRLAKYAKDAERLVQLTLW